MRVCLSSASHWPQTKVTLFVKNSNLVLILGLFLGLDTVAVHLSPVQVHHNTQQLHYCNFTSNDKFHNVTDLLRCLNELASMTIGRRNVRSIDEKNIQFFPKSKEYSQYSPQYSQYLQTINYQSPINLHRGPSYPVNRQENYKYPPAQSSSYQPLTSDSSFTSGILGISLINALSSISQYDDLKCVPRIICEVATGVIPGNNQYKQDYSSSGMNALINFLTAVGSTDTSPLVSFGRPALMGYANRGNPEICYRQYSKCPQNPNEVVNYLNNHNGGFFRFFNNRNTTKRYRINVNDEVLTPLRNFVSDRSGTGELKFDTTTSSIKSKIFNEDKDDKAIKFPDNNKRHFNRLIKSFDYDNEDNRRMTTEKIILFPQDRMDQSTFDQSYYLSQSQLSNEQQNSDNESKMTNAKFYQHKNIPKQNHKSFTFPDGQSVMIDIGFSKLFNRGYKKMLKRGLIMNDVTQSINFEGLSVINLPELYTEDDTSQYIQVIHPCNMICHDSRGITVQFNQIVNSRGTLSTIMTPERPIVDLSQSLPCQIICLNRNGERQQLSTTLNKTLRTNRHHDQDKKYEADKSIKRLKRAPSRNKIIKPRFIGDAFMRSLKLPQERNSPQVPDTDSSSILSLGNGDGWMAGGQVPNYQLQNVFSLLGNMPLIPVPADNEKYSLDGVAVGENPLAFGITVEPRSSDLSSENGDITPIPATVIMCGGYVYFIPVNSERMPVCGRAVDTDDSLSPPKVLFQPRNQWGNYSNFFAQYANIDYFDIINSTGSSTDIHSSTVKFEFPQDLIITQTTTITPITPITPVITELTTQSTESTVSIQSSEILEYQQQSSCLEGESWDTTDHQCVPVKYHKDAEYDYPGVPGLNWDKIPVRKRNGETQKIIIMTPEADMYIESD